MKDIRWLARILPVFPALIACSVPRPNTDPAPAADAKISVDDRYRDRAPTAADEEIVATFPKSSPEVTDERARIERELGLEAVSESPNGQTPSYLASIDRIKQLYKVGRFEASLIEVDDLLHQYPTDARLFEMRGTLLDRIGMPELALRAWEQALHMNPSNSTLHRYLDRRRKLLTSGRGLASP